jgi:beta-phosphoglucomutase-like phosphatase (HAD superfamily)
VPPEHAVAIEDSANGIRSAHAAGMPVVAVPNRHYPPDPDALALAAARLESLADLTPELVTGLRTRPRYAG